MELKYKLIEVPKDEATKGFACNAFPLEPRRLLITKGCPKPVKALREEKVDVIEVPYDEVMKYGGGLHYTTIQLIRDEGPMSFD